MRRAASTIAAMFWIVACFAAEQTPQTNCVSVIVKTQDGSTIVGNPVRTEISLETVFGRVSVPFAMLKAIEREPSTADVVVHMSNGDRLSGKWQDDVFALRTAFGEPKISMTLVRSIALRSENIRQGLILHYSFDKDEGGKVTDASGCGHDGISKRGAWIKNGKTGGAFEVGRRQGYIETPDHPAWSFPGNRFSIALWLKLNALPSGEQMFIANDEGGGERNKWAFEFLNGSICFHINNPDSARLRIAPFQWTPEVGRWYHLAVTCDGTTYSIYVDGQCVATQDNPLAIPDAHAPLTIGQGEGLYVDGAVDEVMIFDRSLSETDIRQLCNSSE